MQPHEEVIPDWLRNALELSEEERLFMAMELESRAIMVRLTVCHACVEISPECPRSCSRQPKTLPTHRN